MGQRLAINVVENDRIIANSYFHWSAYTDSAAQLTASFIEALEEFREEHPEWSSLRQVVEVFRCIGAGFNEKECKFIREEIDNEDLSSDEVNNRHLGELALLSNEDVLWICQAVLCQNQYNCTDRNKGLISITPKGMRESVEWAEGLVEINLSSDTVDFAGLWILCDNDDAVHADLPYCSYEIPIPAFGEYAEFICKQSDDTIFEDVDELLCKIC